MARSLSFSVLVVDDSAVIRSRLVKMIRETCGGEVAEAGSVAEALSVAARLAPSVVILDIRLPQGSGLDVLAKLKAEDPRTRVIVLTNYASEPGYERRCRELGADHFLDKSMGFESIPALLADERVRGASHP